MSIASEIQPEDLLGREVLESRVAKRLRNASDVSEIPPRSVFTPKVGSPNISVDRLFGDLETMTAIGDANAALRIDGVRISYGWVYLTAGDAEKNGRVVVAAPRTAHPANLFHAETWLPGLSAEYYAKNRANWLMHLEAFLNDIQGRIGWMERHHRSP